MSQAIPSNIRTYAVRMEPHQDVKETLLGFARDNHIQAGCILTAVGSLTQVNLRYANQQGATILKGHFEVVSLTGTFSSESAHLHMSVADSMGQPTGGHLLDHNIVYTTLEVIIGDLTDVTFKRETDPAYGYPELVIKPRIKQKE